LLPGQSVLVKGKDNLLVSLNSSDQS